MHTISIELAKTLTVEQLLLLSTDAKWNLYRELLPSASIDDQAIFASASPQGQVERLVFVMHNGTAPQLDGRLVLHVAIVNALKYIKIDLEDVYKNMEEYSGSFKGKELEQLKEITREMGKATSELRRLVNTIVFE